LEEKPLGAHLFLPLTECPVFRLLVPRVFRSVTVKVSDPVRTANADDILTLIFLEELLNWLLVVDDFFALLEDAFVSLLELKDCSPQLFVAMH
jgi:hypothetical protein